MPSTPANEANSAPKLPSAEVRGWVSLFLFIHLFCVVVALVSYTYPSALQERLRTVLAPYLVTFNFDLNPNVYPTGRFYLTHGQSLDVDFEINVEPDSAAKEIAPTKIPELGLWPAARRRHYQSIANAAGSLIGTPNEALESILPRALAGSILKANGAKKGLVQIKGHMLMEMDDLDSSDPARRDPFNARYYNRVYEAHVLVSPGGQVDLIKQSTPGEVAPVEKKKK